MAACEQSPTTPANALRGSCDSPVVKVAVGGPIGRAEVNGFCDRVRSLLDSNDVDVVICDMTAVADPDLGTLDALARLQVTARRLGREVRLGSASWELRGLLALTGLADALPLEALRLQAQGQTEEREDPRGVEEGVHRHDATG